MSSWRRWYACVFCRETERNRVLPLATNNVWFCKSDQTAHLPHAVCKQEAYIVAHIPEQRQGLLVVLLRLATETSDEVAAQTDP